MYSLHRTFHMPKFTKILDKFLVTFIFCILIHSHIILEAKLTCKESPAKIPLKLQGTFVIDRSYQFLEDSTGYIAEIRYLLLDLVDELGTLFQEAEFALTSFSNYQELPAKGASNEDSCYKLHLSFKEKAETHLEEIEQYLKSGKFWNTVSALSAVAHSAVDQKLGWENVGDKTTMKVLFLITDKQSNDPGSNSGFHSEYGAIKGDGKDVSCNHKIPTNKMVGDIASKNKMYIIGFFHLSTLSYWDTTLGTMLPKKTLALSFLDDFHFVLSDVVKNLRKFACKDFANDFDSRTKTTPPPTKKPTQTKRTTTTRRPTQRPLDKPYNTLGPRFLPT